MKHFESGGRWSLEDDFSTSVGGTLVFDNEGLNLKLLEGFKADWGAVRNATLRSAESLAPILMGHLSL